MLLQMKRHRLKGHRCQSSLLEKLTKEEEAEAKDEEVEAKEDQNKKIHISCGHDHDIGFQ